MNKEIKIDKENGSITFINNNIAFSKLGVPREILDLIIELDQGCIKYEKILDKIKEYMKTLSDEYAADNYDIKCDVFNKIYDLLEETE